MMTKFDMVCKKYLGETLMPAPSAHSGQTNANQPNKQTAPAAQSGTQPSEAVPQITDVELMKLLQQKLTDQKFKEALTKLMSTPQTNAVNKPY